MLPKAIKNVNDKKFDFKLFQCETATSCNSLHMSHEGSAAEG
jgi:hypothetical protein